MTTPTPPTTQASPVTTRYELVMGYHRATVEHSGTDPVSGYDRWTLSIQSSLVTSVEPLYYTSDSDALDAARSLLTSLQNTEDTFRQGWYNAYTTASGRESAPETPGPNFVTPPTVAEAPGSVVAKAATTAGEITVSWTAPASDGGAAITSYLVTAQPGNLQASTADGSSTSLTLSGLTTGTAYAFTVASVNSVGTGPASAESNSVAAP